MSFIKLLNHLNANIFATELEVTILQVFESFIKSFLVDSQLNLLLL